MEENPTTITSRPLLYGIATFFVFLAISQFVAYQRYLLIQESEQDQLEHELTDLKERFKTLLNHNTSSVNTLAILYKQDKKLPNFDTVAKEIMQLNKYIDIIYLTDKFTITRSYPSKGNTAVLGKSMLDDPYIRTEALLAFKKKQILFAGPYELANGTGKAIAGRVPVFLNGEFLGFSIAITRLSTIKRFLNITGDDKREYVYQLSKVNPYTKKPEYLFEEFHPQDGLIKSVYMPDGNWNLSVGYGNTHKRIGFPLSLSVLGVLLSIAAYMFVYAWIRRPYMLRKIIESKTNEIASKEKYYRTIIETSSDAIVLLDGYGRVTYQTPSTEKITGYSLQEIQSIDGIELIHPDDRITDSTMFTELVSEPGKVVHRTHRLKHKNGYYIWLDCSYRNLLHDDNVKAIALNYVNATERILNIQKLDKYNREITLLNQVNDHILRIDDEDTLLYKVCQCIIDSGGYPLTLIGFEPRDSDAEQLVKPAFAYGNTAYLDGIDISLKDPVLSKGPTGKVLLTGQTVITNNIFESDWFKPWQDRARAFNLASSIALPLEFDNQKGVLSIYSDKVGDFDENEVKVLERLALNISLAVNAIRTKYQKESAQYDLGERVKELSTIYHLNRILQNLDSTTEEVFSQIVNILPPGWQYQNDCEARIHFDGTDYVTDKYCASPYNQVAHFELLDNRKGFVEIIYTKEQKQGADGYFLKEERDLINTVADTIAVYFNKAAQQRNILESEARFRGAFEHASIGMALVATNNKWLMVNKAICKILGYPEAEMLTLSTHEITHPDDQQKETILLNKTLAGEIDYFRIEKRYYRKDGSIVWVNRNASLIRDASSNPLYFVSQLENITERVESQMKFQNLVEKSLVGVYIIQNGKFVYVNPRIIEESGYTEEELKEIPFDNFIYNEDIGIVYKNIAARLKGEIETTRYEVRIKTKNRELLWMEMFGSMTLYDGTPAIIGTMVDVTNRKNLEIERQKIIQDLVQRNRDLEQFAHIISHNVRAPLSTILGLSSLVTTVQAENEKEMTIKGIEQSAEQLDTVIRDLNEILHIRKDLAELKSNINLHTIVDEVKINLAKSITDTKAVIETDFNDIGELSTVRSYIHSIFYNLISNAIKYANSNVPALINISTMRKDNMILLLFKDNGIGINLDKYKGEVFSMYKRFHLEVEGKGLGLFMVKTQVNALNGTIDIESSPGEGTTFTISFPL